jgi:hypothetical protein
VTVQIDIDQVFEHKQIKKRRKRVVDSCGNFRVIPELSDIQLNITDIGRNWLGMMIFNIQWHGQFFDFRMYRSQIAKIKNGVVSINNNILKHRVAAYFVFMVCGHDEIDTTKYIYNCWKNDSAWDLKFEELTQLLSSKN